MGVRSNLSPPPDQDPKAQPPSTFSSLLIPLIRILKSNHGKFEKRTNNVKNCRVNQKNVFFITWKNKHRIVNF